MTELGPLIDFLAARRRLLVLTGAGLSTASGIPDYRDAAGGWKRQQPVQFNDFMGSAAVRRRYWARSLIGWRHMHRARPNPAHHALVALERMARTEQLVTQNVDRLHQQAGSRDVIDLHGRIDRVTCMSCSTRLPRSAFQRQLNTVNPGWSERSAVSAPDGDADLEHADFARFQVPDCTACGGVVKPDVVFFGEAVPRPRSEAAMVRLARADGLLVVGSSLMVFSGFRFAREAARQRKPMAAVNIGRTRADDLLDIKVTAPCDQVLPAAVQALTTMG